MYILQQICTQPLTYVNVDNRISLQPDPLIVGSVKCVLKYILLYTQMLAVNTNAPVWLKHAHTTN